MVALLVAGAAALAAPATAPAKRNATTTMLTCSANVVSVNSPLSCTATVANTDPSLTTPPSGTVTFTGPASAGVFQPVTCTLSAGSCSTSYTPAPGSEGTQTLVATYAPDTGHSGSTGSRTIKVLQRPASVSLSCSPATVLLGSSTSCTTTVSDTGDATALTPTGSVSLSSDGPGSFTSSTCKLSGSGGVASCSVTYTSGSQGAQTLTASWPGDNDHAGSSADALLVAGFRIVGFLAPINDPITTTNPMSVFNHGSNIPVKFQLADSTGQMLDDATANNISAKCLARLYIDNQASSQACFRYDVKTRQFIYNEDSTFLNVGTHTLNAIVFNGTAVIAEHAVDVQVQ